MFLKLFKKELTPKENKREIFYSIIISYVTIFASVLISLFYTPFLLRTIGTSQYGIHSFAISIVSWLSIITTALCSGYLKFATELAKKDGDNISKLNGLYFWFFTIIDAVVIVVGFVLSFLFWTGVIPLENYTEAERNLVAPCVLLMAINSFISIFVSYFSLYESFKERFVWARLITLLQKMFNPAVCIPLILLGGNVVTVCIIQVISAILNLALLSFHAIHVSKMKVKFGFRFKSDKALTKSVITFSSFALLSTIAVSINQSADQILLGLISDPTSVAIYQLGLSFVSYLSLFCSSITNSLSTKLYRSDLESHEDTNDLFVKISNFQMILAFLIVGGFICCGREFMILWAGEENSAAFVVGAMLFTVNLFTFTSTSSEIIVKSRGYFKFEAIYYLFEAITNVIVSLILLLVLDKQYAIYACCGATVAIMIIFRWIGLSIFYKKKIKLPIGEYFFLLTKFAVITFVCFAFSFGISKLFVFDSRVIELLIKGLSFAILYSLIVYISEKKLINKVWKMMFKRG